mmetsp:Transcript_4344/g.12078  ORF Transcript_4344/g.12078 Transcript_4344/m.12078 type:complete len:238 (+) Transcript_4344:280-993(+)
MRTPTYGSSGRCSMGADTLMRTFAATLCCSTCARTRLPTCATARSQTPFRPRPRARPTRNLACMSPCSTFRIARCGNATRASTWLTRSSKARVLFTRGRILPEGVAALNALRSATTTRALALAHTLSGRHLRLRRVSALQVFRWCTRLAREAHRPSLLHRALAGTGTQLHGETLQSSPTKLVAVTTTRNTRKTCATTACAATGRTLTSPGSASSSSSTARSDPISLSTASVLAGASG